MVKQSTARSGLLLGALGVVFGDIGTNPLYAFKVLFSLLKGDAVINRTAVVGLTSMLFWTVMLVVSLKYITFIMRASNKGEGGIMALVALVRHSKIRHKKWFIALGLLGVALFYGDSAVTPAISVLSAVEGLRVVAPELHTLVIPLTMLCIVVLFAIQRYGTGAIGAYFGPVMLVWFLTIGVAGAWHVAAHPGILAALSPLAGLTFALRHPGIAFVAMGAIVLAVTGAEALYADMGHFGRQPIARTWFWLVLPSLTLCYLGQAALVLNTPQAVQNPFFLLFPDFLRIPAIILATAATLIASQAVISGAFSLTRQAIQLNILPRMAVIQTSAQYIGQIYLPVINGLLLALVSGLVLLFDSSERLAAAYGVAVSGTLAVDSILFMTAMYAFWHSSKLFISMFAVVFLSFDLLMVSANLPKIFHGGWMPVAIAFVALLAMTTWTKGQMLSLRQRRKIEKPLRKFIPQLQDKAHDQLVRLPGQAVYIGHHIGLTPTAMQTAVEELHELHQKAVVVYVNTSHAAHVPPEERISFDALGYSDGISQVVITYGFHDTPNVPKALETARQLSPELDFDPQHAVYFVSLSRIISGRRHGMMTWRKNFYAIMAANAMTASDYFHLPVGNTVEMRTLIKI